MTDELEDAAARVIRSGRYIGGKEVERFEHEFIEHLGQGHAIGCGSGLDALILTLKALEIGPGHEVIVPDLTFAATALAVLRVGATPVLADVEAGTLTLDPQACAAALSPATKAVMPVHLFGQMADLDRLRTVLPPGVVIVEDAAQAHGARRHGKNPGADSAAACYSLYPSKNLGALGDGGMIVTNRAELAGKIRRLANYGQEEKYEFVELGFNSRLDPIQAALAGVRLKHLEADNARRRSKAALYHAEFAGMDDLELLQQDAANECVWHVYPIRVDHRDRVAEALADLGVATQIHYPQALSEIPVIAEPSRCEATPVARRAASRLLSLPLAPSLKDEELAQVTTALAQALIECRGDGAKAS